MAMAVGPSSGDDDEVISAINTTPLVDVMLVLLIIFLITIPVVTTSIPVALPKERVEVRETKPENIIISVDKGGKIRIELPRGGDYLKIQVDRCDGTTAVVKAGDATAAAQGSSTSGGWPTNASIAQ